MTVNVYLWQDSAGWYWQDDETHGTPDDWAPGPVFPTREAALRDAREVMGGTMGEVVDSLPPHLAADAETETRARLWGLLPLARRDVIEQGVALVAAGFIVGERDARRNTAFAGAWMVAQEADESELPTQDSSRGGWCIVGDDLAELIEESHRANLEG